MAGVGSSRPSTCRHVDVRFLDEVAVEPDSLVHPRDIACEESLARPRETGQGNRHEMERGDGGQCAEHTDRHGTDGHQNGQLEEEPDDEEWGVQLQDLDGLDPVSPGAGCGPQHERDPPLNPGIPSPCQDQGQADQVESDEEEEASEPGLRHQLLHQRPGKRHIGPGDHDTATVVVAVLEHDIVLVIPSEGLRTRRPAGPRSSLGSIPPSQRAASRRVRRPPVCIARPAAMRDDLANQG